MEEFISTVNDNPEDYTTAELAAIALHRFVYIHPFTDGNGRIARLITNLVLMKKRYLPIIILKTDRSKYLNYLVLADRQNYAPLVNFVAQYVIKHLDIVLNAIEQKPEERKLSLNEASKLTSISANYLRVLANKGLIPAMKEDKNWVIPKSEIVAYVRRHRRIKKSLLFAKSKG